MKAGRAPLATSMLGEMAAMKYASTAQHAQHSDLPDKCQALLICSPETATTAPFPMHSTHQRQLKGCTGNSTEYTATTSRHTTTALSQVRIHKG